MGKRRRAGGRSRVDWDLLQNLVLVACLVVGVGFTLATTGGDDAPIVVQRIGSPHPPFAADPTALAGAAPAPPDAAPDSASARAPDSPPDRAGLEDLAPAAGPRRPTAPATEPGFATGGFWAIGDFWTVGPPETPDAAPVPLAPALVDRFVTLSESEPNSGAPAP